MNDDPLDRKLEAYAKQPLPSVPSELSGAVWREVERRRAGSFSWEAMLSPRLALAGLAFALLLGIAPAVVFVKLQNSKQLASESLHFDVFSTSFAGQVVSGLAHPQNNRGRH